MLRKILKPLYNKQLLKASYRGDFTTVISAIENGADINAVTEEGNAPLMLAIFGLSKDAHNGNFLEIVKYLLQKNASIYMIRGECAFTLGLRFLDASNLMNVVLDLLLAKIRKHVDNEIALKEFLNYRLLEACSSGAYFSEKAIKLLLQYGAEVNATVCGKTALHQAIACCSCEKVKLLLQFGADINIKNSNPFNHIADSSPITATELSDLVSNLYGYPYYGIKKLISDWQSRQAVAWCVYFQQGANPTNATLGCFVASLPRDILKEIYAYILPASLFAQQNDAHLEKNQIIKRENLFRKIAIMAHCSASFFNKTENDKKNDEYFDLNNNNVVVNKLGLLS